MSEGLRVAIAGVGGRMGQTLVEAVLAQPDLRLAAALEIVGNPLLGRDAGERCGRTTRVVVSSNLEVLRAAVVGTTGLSEADKKALADAAKSIPVVFAPNMSIGVNVLLKLVELAATKLGDDYDVEIVEMHHRHKVDAPSGTALKLGETVASATGRKLDSHGVFAREGMTGARRQGAIGFATLRGGDVVGDHTVVFAGEGERIELTHKAASRMTFAQGALRAARFAAARRAEGHPGLFDMQDVLGLR